MISCKRAAELMTRSADTPLTLRERISFWTHWWVCHACRRLRKQLDVLHRAAIQCRDRQDSGADTLPNDARDRIRKAIRQSDKPRDESP